MNPSENYRILKRLGESNRRKFNTVFLVQHTINGNYAVLKQLEKTATNSHLQERIRAESGFNFDNDGLPKTLDYYESEQEILLFRNFQEGIPLNEWIKSIRQKNKPNILLQIIEKLAVLFEVLNENHCAHLDIKPSNILVSGNENEFSVALIDFGMALQWNKNNERKTLFPLGYAAPELALNRLVLVNQRTDIFALGIVLWNCFTGKTPLIHPNPSITTNLQLTHPIPEHDSLPYNYLKIIQKMSGKHVFAKPPNHYELKEMDGLLLQGMNLRYENLGEVIEDWRKVIEKKKRWGLFYF